MLGLTSGLIQPTYTHRVKCTYNSDFTSNNDGWDPVGIQGTLAQTFDQDIPSGSGGGWMKCQYDTTQTNISSIVMYNDGVVCAAEDWAVGDFAVMSFKIYLAGNWDGVDDVTALAVNLTTSGNKPVTPIPQNQVVERTLIADSSLAGFYSDVAGIVFDESGDLPQEDAIFWIKDVQVLTYGI